MMAQDELFEVTLRDGSAAWFASDPGRVKRRLWEEAHQVTMSDADADDVIADATRALAGNNLDGYQATFWVPPPTPRKGKGPQYFSIWVLFRRSEREPAIADCPKAREVTQEEFDEDWLRDLWLDGNARAVAEAPTYLKSLKTRLG